MIYPVNTVLNNPSLQRGLCLLSIEKALVYSEVIISFFFRTWFVMVFVMLNSPPLMINTYLISSPSLNSSVLYWQGTSVR
jgi:hypothetical protein